MSKLESQLANIFKKGLAADPKAAKSLAAALSQHTDGDGSVTKSEANYHTATDEKCCGNCSNFNGKDKCEVVSGHVTADGVSDYWTDKGSTSKSDTSSKEEDSAD